MSKEKQIEEIKDHIDSIYGCDCAYYGVDGLGIATELYNAGYRKQSENTIEVPCKVGDTVWYELYGQIESAVIYSCVGIATRSGFIITDANAKDAYGLEVEFSGKGLGKSVFLTKEEAERALKGEAYMRKEDEGK